MVLKELLLENPLVLAEGAVIERIKREFKYTLDPQIENASMVYDETGRKILAKIYNQYMSVARKFKMPMLNLTPTWRANPERIHIAGFEERRVNADCVEFVDLIRNKHQRGEGDILIGGIVGCKGDAYNPEEALSSDEARVFHKIQISELSEAGVDFLFATTLPACSEALGIAKAMAETNKEYVISFVIHPYGALLDGTPLYEAISIIDSSTSRKPVFYMLNCVHPTICKSALNMTSNDTDLVKTRLKGLQANGSPKSPEELESLDKMESENPKKWAEKMIDLYLNFGMRILGGCCGTTHHHITAIAKTYMDMQKVKLKI